MSEQLAIQASEELALTVDANQVREIDAVDLPPLPAQANRILAAFRIEATTTEAGPQTVIALKTAVHENYEIPSALATFARLTTYLDPRGGQRTEAIFEVANAGKQFLTIRLPDGAELWSLRIGNEQAKPQQSAAGDYQVALGKLGKPVAVKIVYAWQPAKASLKRLRLGGVDLPGVRMNQMNWLVIPPPDYWVSEQQSKMQTSDLAKPVPAYIHLYRYLARSTRPRIVWGTNLGSSRQIEREQRHSLVFRAEDTGVLPATEAYEDALGQMGGAMRGPTPPPAARPVRERATATAGAERQIDPAGTVHTARGFGPHFRRRAARQVHRAGHDGACHRPCEWTANEEPLDFGIPVGARGGPGICPATGKIQSDSDCCRIVGRLVAGRVVPGRDEFYQWRIRRRGIFDTALRADPAGAVVVEQSVAN
jgi:hypothetical protein